MVVRIRAGSTMRRSVVQIVQLIAVAALCGCASGPLPGDRLTYVRGEDPKAAHTQFEQQVQILTGQLTASFKTDQPQRIAVLSFENTGGRNPDVLGAYLTEKVTNSLFAARVGTIVERTFLNKVLQEIERSYSGPFDPLSLKEIGHLLNADTLVLGSYTPLNNGLTEIMARAVSAETGEVLGAGTTTVSSSVVPAVPVYQPPVMVAQNEVPRSRAVAPEPTVWQAPEAEGPGTVSIVPSPAASYSPIPMMPAVAYPIPTYPVYQAAPVVIPPAVTYVPRVIGPYYSVRPRVVTPQYQHVVPFAPHYNYSAPRSGSAPSSSPRSSSGHRGHR